jgi:ABC-type polysaccharide/polyol phosphate transport system ATPase subunit
MCCRKEKIMEDKVIEVNHLNKIYKLYDKPTDRLKESLSLSRKRYHKEHYALKDISFEVRRKEIIGLIGTNGAGKSTLLKIITGVLTETSGQVNINGKISALLELGAGFNPEYTGIENIYLNGTMSGYSKTEMDSKLKSIIDFADIGEFINQPVKTYSSGMFARLAFAVAINIDPDILIVDEALSVGDIRFQQRCFRKMEEFKETKTILLVSHDLGAITKFCDRVIWIEHGEVMAIGEPLSIVKQYQAYIMDSKLTKSQTSDKKEKNIKKNMALNEIDNKFEVYGDKKALITGIGLFNSENNIRTEFAYPNDQLKLIIRVKYNDNLVSPIIGFTVNDRLGNIIFQTNSNVLDYEVEINNEICDYCFEFKLPDLNNGSYTISPAVASGTQDNHIQHNWVHDAIAFNVIRKELYNLQGIMYLTDINFYEMN